MAYPCDERLLAIAGGCADLVVAGALVGSGGVCGVVCGIWCHGATRNTCRVCLSSALVGSGESLYGVWVCDIVCRGATAAERCYACGTGAAFWVRCDAGGGNYMCDYCPLDPTVFAEWSNNRDIFKWFVNFGAIGVDIFFALSGYLIGAILLRTMVHFDDFAVVKRFLVRRWLRTLPAAYVSAVVVWFVAAPKNVFDYIKSILFVGSLNPWQLSTENTFWWSLSTEELFYLLFPLLLFLCIKIFPRVKAFAITIIIFASLAMLSRVVLAWTLPSAIIDNIQYVSYACVDAMVWGILLQWVRQSRPAWFVRLSQIGFAPGAVIFAAGVALLLDPLRWVVLTLFACHILIVIGAVLMIPAMESIKTLGWRVLDRVVGWIALISYSLYLYQCMMSDFVFNQYGYATSWGMVATSLALYFGLTFLASAISYYGVEAPVLRWRDRQFTDMDR